ncbi:MAG TPA: hypothetical protein PKC91_04860 [Ignavibacteria bacterium]|nr:hypothetical protein [Ignavibacteria bacterium]
MNTKILLILFIVIPFTGFLYDEPVITPDDLNILTGKKWTGKLTYLDYSSNKLVSIPAEVTVLNAEDSDAFIFINGYPDEPKANNTDTVRIEENGKKFGNETVTERISETDGILKIITSEEGMDNDKPAVIRHTYIISSTGFTIIKDVRYEGENNFINRNTCLFERAD